jgi:hypothetical protein
MKNCEAGVELDRDETLSDGEETDKKNIVLMSFM